MSIAIYDADIHSYPYLLPNLEIMKLATYYKKRGEIVVFSPTIEPERYSKFIYWQDYYNWKTPPSKLEYPNIEYGGLQFSNNIYKPLDLKIESQVPDTDFYLKFLNSNGISQKHKENLKTILNGWHFRLSLDGKSLWKDYNKQIDYEKKTYGGKLHIFSHDLNLNNIIGAFDEIEQIILNTSNKTVYLGTKYPIKVNNVDDFIKWSKLNLSPNNSEICYCGELPKKEEIDKILPLLTKKQTKYSYMFSSLMNSEEDFLQYGLLGLVRMVRYLKIHDAKILLNSDSPLLWEREEYGFLIDFLNAYLSWNGDIRGHTSYRDFCTAIYRYKNNYYSSSTGFSIKNRNKLLSFLKENSPNTYDFFEKGG